MMYEWMRALHLIAMVAWFAGLFYIFRLFVYHVRHRDNATMAATFSTMERRLLYGIMHPAMTLTLIGGVAMIVMQPVWLKAGWFHTKLLLVLFLVGYQIFAGRVQKRFARGDFFLSEKACRIINEVPTVLLIVIVLLAVLKP